MKKRVHVPFPPAPVNVSTVVKPPPRKLAKTDGDKHQQSDKHLLTEALREREDVKRYEIHVLQEFSAHKHPYSMRLCLQFEDLNTTPPEVMRISKADGKISFDVQLSSSSGYGCAVWCFCLGGGVGDDMSPVALRCTNQISHYQVDDMGFINAIFWKVVGRSVSMNGYATGSDLSELPCLFDILTGVVNMLLGPFVRRKNCGDNINLTSTTSGVGSGADDNTSTAHGKQEEEVEEGKDQDFDGYSTEEHQERWTTAEQETERKVQLKLTYRAIALLPTLVGAPSADVQNNGGCDSPSGSGSGSGSGWPDLTWLAPSFLELLGVLKVLSAPASTSAQRTSAEHTFRTLVTENSPGIFSFDLFSLSFCDTLLQELDHYEASGLPQRRPNTMNNYGLVLNEIGMQPLMDALLQLVEPIAHRLFITDPVVYGLDHHHSFLVQYKSNHLKGDRGLDMHHDASEVTLNVCLGRDNFKGGDLLFCGMADLSNHRKYQFSYTHVKGRAVMHLGRHRHGAEDILPASANTSSSSANINSTDTTSNRDRDTTEDESTLCDSVDSERLNLIMWLRSSIFRSAAAYGHISPDGFPKMKEDLEPDLCCLSKYNDTDYHTYLPKSQP